MDRVQMCVLGAPRSIGAIEPFAVTVPYLADVAQNVAVRRHRQACVDVDGLRPDIFGDTRV
jgi:hypothetical protein